MFGAFIELGPQSTGGVAETTTADTRPFRGSTLDHMHAKHYMSLSIRELRWQATCSATKMKVKGITPVA